MKKFGKIEAKYLKIGRSGVDLLVFLSLVRSAPLTAWREVEGENAADKMKERKKKKKVFNWFRDEQ
jgi:hypothetical protein